MLADEEYARQKEQSRAATAPTPLSGASVRAVDPRQHEAMTCGLATGKSSAARDKALGYPRIGWRSPGADAPTAVVDRLKPADVMLIWPERVGWPQEIGVLAIVEGVDLAEDCEVQLDNVAAHIEAKLDSTSRLRQGIAWPSKGLGWPVWVDVPAFDVKDHVAVARVQGSGTDRDLLDTCERLRRQPLDPTRPLWKMWFITGLPGGAVGWFVKLHHAIADGIAGVALLVAFVDFEPTSFVSPKKDWTPREWPSGHALRRDAVMARRKSWARGASKFLHPVRILRRLKQAWPAVREIFASGRAPRTSLNEHAIGSDRSLRVVRAQLEELKGHAHSVGATVNDVLLTAVGAGYRALLTSRGEQLDGKELRAFVPISLHGADEDVAVGNVDASMIVPLPLDEEDDHARLRSIARDTAERKKLARPSAGTLFSSRAVQRLFLRMMPRQRFMNAYVANVPGPPVPMWLGPARIRDLYPIVPITANVSIGVGAMSYGNHFNVTVVADRDLCPDIDVFADALGASLQHLTRPGAHSGLG